MISPTTVEPAAGDAQLTRAAPHAVDQELIEHLQAEALANRAKIENLEIALITARRIGAAIGILMATRNLTDVQAFDALRAASQHTRRKLREVAEDVIFTGMLA